MLVSYKETTHAIVGKDKTDIFVDSGCYCNTVCMGNCILKFR